MIEFRNVSRSFGGLSVIKDLSFHIEANKVVSILGPSGIGKTTILRLITGAIKPDSGEVRVSGRKTGYIFQDPRLLPWRTALENVSLGLVAEGKERKVAEGIARRWMDCLGLAGFEDYYPAELSGGMMQRVSIGRALAIEPDILLMDEPFSNLNAELKDSLLSMIEDILTEYKTTVVYVTHDISEAVRLSDWILTIQQGSVMEEILPHNFSELGKKPDSGRTYSDWRGNLHSHPFPGVMVASQ